MQLSVRTYVQGFTCEKDGVILRDWVDAFMFADSIKAESRSASDALGEIQIEVSEVSYFRPHHLIHMTLV